MQYTMRLESNEGRLLIDDGDRLQPGKIVVAIEADGFETVAAVMDPVTAKRFGETIIFAAERAAERA